MSTNSLISITLQNGKKRYRTMKNTEFLYLQMKANIKLKEYTGEKKEEHFDNITYDSYNVPRFKTISDNVC